MCEFSGSLTAWLDHELPAEEAARLAWHVRACPDCRSNLELYKRVSSTFDAYCDAIMALETASVASMASMTGRRVPRWVPALPVAAALLAAAFALFLIVPHTPLGQRLLRSAGVQGAATSRGGTASELPKRLRPRAEPQLTSNSAGAEPGAPDRLGFPPVGKPWNPRLQPQSAATPPGLILEKTPAPVKRAHHQHLAEQVPKPDPNWRPPQEPAIQIAIPAEAVFPPGAVPEGVNFIGDINVAADGTVQQLRLRPRLAGFSKGE